MLLLAVNGKIYQCKLNLHQGMLTMGVIWTIIRFNLMEWILITFTLNLFLHLRYIIRTIWIVWYSYEFMYLNDALIYILHSSSSLSLITDILDKHQVPTCTFGIKSNNTQYITQLCKYQIVFNAIKSKSCKGQRKD